MSRRLILFEMYEFFPIWYENNPSGVILSAATNLRSFVLLRVTCPDFHL